MTSALDTQVSGNHYKNMKYQPIEFCVKLRLTFIEGNIIKYVTRFENKNGLEDLKKVHHYIRLNQELAYRDEGLISWELAQTPFTAACIYDEVEDFSEANNLSDLQKSIIQNVLIAKYQGGECLDVALVILENLMNEKYGSI